MSDLITRARRVASSLEAWAAGDGPHSNVAEVSGAHARTVRALIEAAAIVAVEHEAWKARALAAEASLLRVTEERDEANRDHEQHLAHVSRFLNELYCTMIDPCAAQELNVRTACRELLAAAEAQRDQIAAAEAELSALRGEVEKGLEPERLAAQFHEAYERLAPQFAYKTRVASAVPWAEVPSHNKRLMIAVATEIAASLLSALKGG